MIVERLGREAGRPLREGKHGWRVVRHTMTGSPHTAPDTTPVRHGAWLKIRVEFRYREDKRHRAELML